MSVHLSVITESLHACLCESATSRWTTSLWYLTTKPESIWRNDPWQIITEHTVWKKLPCLILSSLLFITKLRKEKKKYQRTRKDRKKKQKTDNKARKVSLWDRGDAITLPQWGVWEGSQPQKKVLRAAYVTLGKKKWEREESERGVWEQVTAVWLTHTFLGVTGHRFWPPPQPSQICTHRRAAELSKYVKSAS